MCFGGGGNTNTVVQQPNVPPDVLAGVSNLIGRANSVTTQPYNAPPSPDQQVAPLNQDQSQAFGQVRGVQGQYQPYIAGATDLAARGSAPIAPSLGTFDSAALSKYGNPYLSDVIGNVNTQFDRQRDIGAQGIAGQAASAGAFGGDRAAIATQEANRNNDQLRANTIAGLENQNFSQAQNQFNVEQNRGLAARESDSSNAFTGAGSLQGIAGNNLSLGLTGASALQGVGGVEQQQQQNLNNAGLSNFYDARNFPYQQLSAYQSAVSGTPFSAFGSTTKSPGPSPISQVAGLGTAALGGIGAYKYFTGSPTAAATTNYFPGGGDLSGAAAVGSDFGNASSGAGYATDLGSNFLAARGGMVRARVRYANGGIAGYDDGGPVYAQPQVDAADELGLSGSFADRMRAAMARSSSRAYGGPWTDGINLPVGEQAYPQPAPPSSPDGTVGDREAMSPEAQGPQEPMSAQTERLMRLAANGDQAALAALYPPVTPPGTGPVLPPASTNPTGQVMPIGRGADFPDLRGTPEAEAITTGKTPGQIAEERMAAQMPPTIPYAPETDIAGAPAPVDSTGQGIGAASAATLNPAEAPPDAGEPAGIAPPMPSSKPAPGATQPITPSAKPGKSDIIVDGGKRFAPGTLTKSVLPSGIASKPVDVDGQAVQAPPAGQGINVADLKASARAAQEPSSGIPEWALPLMRAGFAMMSGTSKFPLVNIGAGAATGVDTFQKQRQIDATNQLKSYELERKLAHDKGTIEYQRARVAGMDERTKAQFQWHQDQINATERAHAANQITLDQARADRAQHQRAMEALIGDRNEGRKTPEERESDAQDKRDAVADRGETAYRKSLINSVTGDWNDPAKGPQQMEDYLIRNHSKSTQGQAAIEARAERQVSAVPPAAIDYLKKNPGARAQFEQKYGKGLAARVLGE